jgi:hypothetical protein
MAIHKDESRTSTIGAPTCRDDWRRCADNADLARNYGGSTMARIRCKTAAAQLAKYGDPKFPSAWDGGPFGMFVQGNDFLSNKSIVFFENDAQFQNMFGAMLHVRLRCVYDLEHEQVTDVSNVPRL